LKVKEAFKWMILEDQDGMEMQDWEKNNGFQTHFQLIFASSICDVTRSEAKELIWGVVPIRISKDLGLDGLSFEFCLVLCHAVSDDLLRMYGEGLYLEHTGEQLNARLYLIQGNKKYPMGEWRLITLLNVSYKALTKLRGQLQE
jgi:hypothetical protein